MQLPWIIQAGDLILELGGKIIPLWWLKAKPDQNCDSEKLNQAEVTIQKNWPEALLGEQGRGSLVQGITQIFIQVVLLEMKLCWGCCVLLTCSTLM